MLLAPCCPRCTSPVTEWDGTWACSDHGPVPPLWRPREASYDAFTAHLRLAAGFPTFLPWPMSPGWAVTDFGVVAQDPEAAQATVTVCSGTSQLDGPVDVLVVSEEPGTGVGARCAAIDGPDPGGEVGEGPPAVKVRIGSQAVPLWAVSTSRVEGEWDRSVLCGEAEGRWLWIVLRPASAVLLLRDDWILRDVSAVGPAMVEMPFGGNPPAW